MREPLFPQVITSSTRSVFNACPQKFFNSVVCGLSPRGSYSNVHIHAGKSYAKALEAYRRSYHEHRDYDKAVAAGFLALIQAFGTNDPPEGETKNFDRTVGAFIEYLIQYPSATDHLKPLIGALGPAVEFSFAFDTGVFHPVSGEPILYGGTLDQLVEFNSAYFIYDDKTTGAMGSTWKHQWTMRSQFTGYVYGLKNAMPEVGEKVLGAIVRGMCILKTEYKTQEVIAMRPDWFVERWKQRLVWDIQRMVQCWKENYWPHVGEENGECSHFGQCIYTVLCMSQYPENYLPIEFEVVRKDPMSKERLENGD